MKTTKTLFLKTFFLIFLLFFLQMGWGQEEKDSINRIEIRNSSFENLYRTDRLPTGWIDCGKTQFPEETPPDVDPEKIAEFGFTKKAKGGKNFLNLVVRENDSWEYISQRLAKSLHPEYCYQIKLFLCTAEKYLSKLRGNPEIKSFTHPIKLRIWGGNGSCQKQDLLAESRLIINNDWEEFEFFLKPKKKWEFITFEAFYKTPTFEVPNGNILIDNISDIDQIPCEDITQKSLPENYHIKLAKAYEKNKKNAEILVKKKIEEEKRIAQLKIDHEIARKKRKEERKRIAKLKEVREIARWEKIEEEKKIAQLKEDREMARKKKSERELKGFEKKAQLILYHKKRNKRVEAFSSFAQYAKDFPEFKIHFFISDYKLTEMEFTKTEIEEVFIKNGLLKSNFEIKTIKEKAKKVNWFVEEINFAAGFEKL